MARLRLQWTPQDSCTSQNRTDTAFAKSTQPAARSRQSPARAPQDSVEMAVLRPLPNWIIPCTSHLTEEATCISPTPATIESGKLPPAAAPSPQSPEMARQDLLEMEGRQL